MTSSLLSRPLFLVIIRFRNIICINFAVDFFSVDVDVSNVKCSRSYFRIVGQLHPILVGVLRNVGPTPIHTALREGKYMALFAYTLLGSPMTLSGVAIFFDKRHVLHMPMYEFS